MSRNLFGQTREQLPQKFPVSRIDSPDHRRCTSEEKSVLTSALIKYMRLGDVERCMELYWRMRIVGVPQEYIVRRVCAFCWEDAVGSEILTYATALQTTWVHDADNAIMRTVIACCKAPKFWSSRDEADLEAMRIRVREHVKEKAKKGKLVIDDFPAWVRDLYTIQGREALKEGKTLDCRYSGILRGGNNLRAETIAYGRASPDKPSLYDSEIVRESAKRHQSVDEYMEHIGMNPKDMQKQTKN